MRSWAAPFKGFDPETIPTGEHPGAFGVRRRHHFHEGVDLHCPEGTPITAVEAGVVVAVVDFTGEKAGSPWWLPTSAVMVRCLGLGPLVVYGEIVPCARLRVGMTVEQGDLLGHVARVLRNDKGKPTSMLHIEVRAPGHTELFDWGLDVPKPGWLRDPTPYLKSIKP